MDSLQRKGNITTRSVREPQSRELSRLQSKDCRQQTVRLPEMVAESYLSWSVLVQNLFPELQKWR